MNKYSTLTQNGVNWVQRIFLSAIAITMGSCAFGQSSDDWAGLRRTTYDTDDATLRIPCVRVTNANSNTVTGLAPAFSINLISSGNNFILGENLRELSTIPASCLDSLALSSDGNSATYTTSSAQLDSDAALFRDIYFTIELAANLSSNPVSFNVVSASSRAYTRAGFQSAAVQAAITDKQQIFDDTDLESLSGEIVRRLVVSEPGVYDAVCRYKDVLGGVIELIETVNGNKRYRINQNLTSANNGSTFFNAECDVYNRDLNLFETRLERIAIWFLALP